MEIDLLLIQQLEELCDGESVHLHANLVGSYRTAVSELKASGHAEYRDIAVEAEHALRSLLSRMRLKRARGVVLWR